MSDLKPCPFCGNEAAYVRHTGTETDVYCQNCAVLGPLILRNDEEEAIAAWNTRVLPAEQLDAAAIQEIAEGLLSLGDNLTYIAAATDANLHRDAYSLRADVLALIDNPGNDTIATLYSALAQGQKRLGADFEAVWDANVDILYDNNGLGKEQK